jgi:hypothetical protein
LPKPKLKIGKNRSKWRKVKNQKKHQEINIQIAQKFINCLKNNSTSAKSTTDTDFFQARALKK